MGQESMSLPEMSTILGFLELLKDRGGKEDIYKLSAELQLELGEMLRVIRGAEMLHLVHTPGGDVVIEKTGTTLCDADINERKQLINKQLRTLPLFKAVMDYLKERTDYQVSRDEMLEKLAEILPNENAETSFSNLINWGRYAELFGYNDDTQTFYVDRE